MIKVIRLFPLLFILVGVIGCVSSDFAYEQLAECPQYFQDNIGDVRAKPLSPLGLILLGRVDPNEPGCPIHLYGLNNKFIVHHEAFHSFEMRSYLRWYDEWELFQNDFGEDTYLGSLVIVMMAYMPGIEYIPVPGKVRFYSNLSRLEDAADCFAYWMQIKQGKKLRKDKVLQRKLSAIEKFVTGWYILDYGGE